MCLRLGAVNVHLPTKRMHLICALSAREEGAGWRGVPGGTQCVCVEGRAGGWNSPGKKL